MGRPPRCLAVPGEGSPLPVLMLVVRLPAPTLHSRAGASPSPCTRMQSRGAETRLLEAVEPLSPGRLSVWSRGHSPLGIWAQVLPDLISSFPAGRGPGERHGLSDSEETRDGTSI